MGLQHSQGVRLAVKSSGLSLVVRAGWLHAPHQFSYFFRNWRAGLSAPLLVTVIARLRSCSDLTQSHIPCKIDLRSWGKDYEVWCCMYRQLADRWARVRYFG